MNYINLSILIKCKKTFVSVNYSYNISKHDYSIENLILLLLFCQLLFGSNPDTKALLLD